MNEIQFILYQLPEEEGKVQVVIKNETIWATQKAMAQLFGVGVPAISKHLKNIFEENELDAEVVVSKMEITTQHGASTLLVGELDETDVVKERKVVKIKHSFLIGYRYIY